MRITNTTELVSFYKNHPEAKGKLETWHRICRACEAGNHNELRQTFRTADYVPERYTIFNVGGNSYRIVTEIHYKIQTVLIRHVFTHPQYDKWTKQNRRE